MDNVSFRYTRDEEGYIKDVYFGCTSGNCFEFIGDSTDYGYPTWDAWVNSVHLNAWRVTMTEGVYQLHHDASREASLKALHKKQKEENKPVTKSSLENDIFDFVARQAWRRGTACIGNLAFEWGYVEVTTGDEEKEGSYGGHSDVAFSRVFAETPGIVTSFSGMYTNQISTSSYDADGTGFKASARLSTPNSTRTVQWIAIGIVNSQAFG